MFRRILLYVACASCAMAAHAHQYELGTLVIGHPWSRPTAPGMPMGVAYLSITNAGKSADALVAASSPAAARVEFHQTTLSDGVARMRPLAEIAIAPGATVKIEPGGIHVMLAGLKEPLLPGKSVPLVLEFRVAGKITVELSVEARDAPPAAENTMTQSLGVVTVVARRPSSLPTQIPTTIEGVSGETVKRTVNATDSEDALKYFPSLNVRKRYIGDFDHAVLASRASGTQNSARSLVYADGILLSNLLGNGATFTPRWGLVTPEEIERVDVLYGPFSAAYPGNSVGAVVDYITRMPASLELRASMSSFVEDFEVYSTDESYGGWQASASYGDARGDSAWWVNFNRLDSQSHPIAYGTRLVDAGTPGTVGIPVTGALAARNPRNQDWWLLGATNTIDTVQDHVKLKFAQQFGPEADRSWRLAYTFGAWKNDAERSSDTWLRDASGAPVYAGNVNIGGRVFAIGATDMGPSSAALTHVMHGLALRKRHLGNWDIEAAASRYDYRRDATRSPTIAMPVAAAGGAGRIADQHGTGWSTFALRTSRGGDSDAGHFVELGLSSDRYRLRTEVLATDDWIHGAAGARIAAFRGETALTSFFAQDSWRFAPDWQATLGARLEYWQADNGAISNATQSLAFPRRSDTYISPKLALSWAVSGITTLKASIGRAYRAPTVAELYQGSIAANSIVNNDPDLAPERSWTAELSAVNDLDHGRLRATLFFEDTRDALYSQVNVAAGSTVTTVQNIQRIGTRGAEFAAEWRVLESLELSGSLTWAHSRILANAAFPASVGSRQPRVPDWRATALASWQLREHLAATLGARYSGLQFGQLDNTDLHGTAYTGTSDYLVYDARLRFIFGRLHAALGVDNLGNERYWAFHPYSRRTYNAEIATEL
jgi:iron complex outermembrane recepter protein